MKRALGGWLLVALVVPAIAGTTRSQDKPGEPGFDIERWNKIIGDPTPKTKPVSDLDRLLAERVVAAFRVYQKRAAIAEAGSGKLEVIRDLLQAARRLFEAELAMTAVPKDRIAVLERAVTVEKEFERIIKARVDAGVLPDYELENARYDRLTAEIELEKAKKAAPGPK
ncbi:MAG: hypothetical protein K2P78_01980 [Gemmataceae bacterium]|nr:hypothetical protein [Gemmataceae bacterium]